MPTLGVQVVVIKDKQVLLTLREDIPMWCLPGGRVEAGESVAQAAIREVYEETGVQVVLTRLVGVYSRPDWANGGDHGVVFTAKPKCGVPRPLDGEAIDVQYFAVDALPPRLFWWDRQRIMDGVVGETAVSHLQNTPWPFPNMTADEFHAARRSGSLNYNLHDLMEQCMQPGDELREVG